MKEDFANDLLACQRSQHTNTRSFILIAPTSSAEAPESRGQSQGGQEGKSKLLFTLPEQLNNKALCS